MDAGAFHVGNQLAHGRIVQLLLTIQLIDHIHHFLVRCVTGRLFLGLPGRLIVVRGITQRHQIHVGSSLIGRRVGGHGSTPRGGDRFPSCPRGASCVFDIVIISIINGGIIIILLIRKRDVDVDLWTPLRWSWLL